jgi:hypothetical protein
MATGRPAASGLRYRVPELLRGKGLDFDEVHLAPPKGTLSFKKRLLFDTIRRFPFIDTVRIWDDRRSHLPEFVSIAQRAGISPENIFVRHVRSRSKPPECEEVAGVEVKETTRPPSYLAVFLDARSKAALSHAFPYVHHKARADHMTITNDVTPDHLELIGQPVRMRVVGYAVNDEVQAVVVKPTPDLVEDRVPHITLSFEEGSSAKESNTLLGEGWKRVSGPTLTGVIDTFPRSLTPARRVALLHLWKSR